MFQSKFANYTVYTGIESLSMLNHYIGNRQFVILCDENTILHCLPILKKWINNIDESNVFVLPSGEENKNMTTVNNIWNWLLNKNVNSSNIIINLGGGVITDIGGFAASTFHRGIPYIQIPTTLMGQVDASIGNKNGVNFDKIKNCIGLFSSPLAVINYPGFIATLPIEQIRSGMGEVFKHALIADNVYWEKLKIFNSASNEDLINMIAVSVEIKKTIIALDPNDHGYRHILNCGHTVGHAIESFFLAQGKTISHGEAVVAGILIESLLAVNIRKQSTEVFNEIFSTLIALFPKINIINDDFQKIISFMNFDKKNSSKGINFSLIEKIGTASINNYITDIELIKQSIFQYTQL